MTDDPRVLGPYDVFDELARGGMASVHLARLRAGDWRPIVALKLLRANVARDPEFVAMFLDEARIATRIQHPNVVQTLDVVRERDELALVMEYVHGESLATLTRAAAARRERVPSRIAGAIFVGLLEGLHAAHEARDDAGASLAIVHRDVSPQNVLVAADGSVRVIDFGVAKAAHKLHQTKKGAAKGKLAYMAPEQLTRDEVTRSADIHAASVVLWESLTGQRFAAGKGATQIVEQVLYGRVVPPSELAPELPPCVDALVARGLARAPADRFASAREMATAVADCLGVAAADEVAAWVERLAGDSLRDRARRIEALRATDALPTPSPRAPPRLRSRSRSRSPSSFVRVAVVLAVAILVVVAFLAAGR